MRMYVILAVFVLLVAGIVALLVARQRTAAERARKREAMAARLNAVVERAEQENRAASAEIKASVALTTVLPVISTEERAPRHVA